MAFYDKFIELCNERGESPSFVARSVGVDKSAATRWSRGSVPRDTTLLRLAEHFGVSADELLDRVPSGVRTQNKVEYAKNTTYDNDTGLEVALEALRNQPGRRALLSATKNMTEAQVLRFADWLNDITGGNKD